MRAIPANSISIARHSFVPWPSRGPTLANANARLGVDADRYSFTVVDPHLLLFAGFDRRDAKRIWIGH
jgi:hypothetical protein